MDNRPIEVFQTDSGIIKEAFQKNNYFIQEEVDQPKEYCAIYFSSNFIYYPNNTETFTKSILNKDRYEWPNLKLEYAQKHIFIRDIKKQWYLEGINDELNTPEKLKQFLYKETKNYKTITIGSSAGGYAAVLYGQLLNSERTYCFNGQFEVASLLNRSKESIDPLIFRYRENKDLLPYYDLRNFIKTSKIIYYFASSKSTWDIAQIRHVKNWNLNSIYYNTAHHGVPFPKIVLKEVFAMDKKQLDAMVGKTYHPIYFSIKLVGIYKTVTFLTKVIWLKYFKKT